MAKGIQVRDSAILGFLVKKLAKKPETVI